MLEINWEERCRKLEDAITFALTDEMSGVPRCSGQAKKALRDALEGRPTPRASAEAEYRREIYRKAVEEAKEQLRAKAARPWWVKLFPWRITIERREA